MSSFGALFFFYARAKIFVSGENNNFFFKLKRKIKDIEVFLVLLKIKVRNIVKKITKVLFVS